MGKRKKLVEEINSILGTKLELKRVTLGELEQLHDAISTRTTQLPIGQNIQGLLNVPLVEILRKKLEHKKFEDLKVRDFLEIFKEGTEDKGPLGLGILPAFMRRRK